jgi:Flp pilus assembly protein TadG
MGAGLGAVRRRRSEDAQATVEFALVLPLLFAMIWLGVEASLLLRDQVLVTHAAREAARSSAVGMTAAEAADAGRARTDLGSLVVIDVASGGAAGDTTVATAHLPEAGRLPMIGRLVPGLEVRASVTMRVEGAT